MRPAIELAALTLLMTVLLQSADASWEESDAGHDWREACEQARAALKAAKEGT